jgi:hypothetical protein
MMISMWPPQRSTMSPYVSFQGQVVAKQSGYPYPRGSGRRYSHSRYLPNHLRHETIRQSRNSLPQSRMEEESTPRKRIGTVVARRMALGWGMRLLYHNRSKLAQEPTDFKVEYKANLEELLAESDIVSLHIPVSQSSTLVSSLTPRCRLRRRTSSAKLNSMR